MTGVQTCALPIFASVAALLLGLVDLEVGVGVVDEGHGPLAVPLKGLLRPIQTKTA